MNIRIKDLLQVMNILQNAVKRFDSINLGDKDYYWDLFEEELYNPYQKPTELSLGQLSFDWENLLRLKRKDETPVSNDLKLLGAILRATEDSHTITLY
jgi:hypothetical protein